MNAHVSVDGYDFALTARGSGSTIVCIHGSVDDLRTWNRQVPAFSGHHRIVTYSRRWHWPNSATGSDRPYRAVDHAADLADIIRALSDDAVHLVGASYGAIVAMLVASRHSHLVRSLVLGEPPLFTMLAEDKLAAHLNETIAPARFAFDAGDPAAGVAGFLEQIAGVGAFTDFPPAARAAALDNAFEFGLEVHSSVADYFGPLTRDDLRNIRVPVLLVRGERSPAIFGDVLDVLDDTLPNAGRLTIPNASHAMHRHNPTLYNAAVLRFIEDAN